MTDRARARKRFRRLIDGMAPDVRRMYSCGIRLKELIDEHPHEFIPIQAEFREDMEDAKRIITALDVRPLGGKP